MSQTENEKLYWSDKSIRKIAMWTFGILLITPVSIYLYTFRGFPLSNNPDTWGNFGEYLNGTFMPLIALAGVLITYRLGKISDERIAANALLEDRRKASNAELEDKRKASDAELEDKRAIANLELEKEKHRPLLNIDYFDGEAVITIDMSNKGSGPLIISSYKVYDSTNNVAKDGLYSFIPAVNGSYLNFTGSQVDKVLAPGEEVNLLAIEQPEEELEEEGEGEEEVEYDDGVEQADNEWETDKNNLRKILGDLTIEIDYMDVYGRKMPTYKRSLKWFVREKRDLQVPR